ncbi:hypothetical protein ACFLRF_01720 [Candidatus Altiarchaeota archaeon]
MKRIISCMIIVFFLSGCIVPNKAGNSTDTGLIGRPAFAGKGTTTIPPIQFYHDKCFYADEGWGWHVDEWNRTFCLPNTLESCLKIDGFWGPVGDDEVDVCNFPTSDEGAVCTDSKQCLGDCLAELNVEELKTLTIYLNGTVKTNGTCAGYMVSTGPVTRVFRGVVYNLTLYG